MMFVMVRPCFVQHARLVHVQLAVTVPNRCNIIVPVAEIAAGRAETGGGEVRRRGDRVGSGVGVVRGRK